MQTREAPDTRSLARAPGSGSVSELPWLVQPWRQTGHADPKMLEVYAREHAPLVGNAVTRLDL